MSEATLFISSRNYSSWSLRGFLLARLSRLPFRTQVVAGNDATTRAELLLVASSIRIPCLIHDGVTVWDTLAIAEYLHEVRPRSDMLPRDRMARARCRSISGEMHSGFAALRSALPMNLRARRPGVPIWSGVQADIDRITEIWRECLDTWQGPWLFGRRPSIADCMFAPVATRFATYEISLDAACAAYRTHIMGWPDLQEWLAAARQEPEQIDELEIEF